MTLHAAATYRAPVACRATTPTPTRRRATTTRRATRTRAAADPMAVEDGTIDLVVSTEAAKKTWLSAARVPAVNLVFCQSLSSR